MAIVFPPAPAAGEKFIASNGITYTWNSTVSAWTTTGISGSGGSGGGTVTGVTASAPLASSGGNSPNITATLTDAATAAAGTSASVLMTPQFAVPKNASGMTGAALLPGGNDGARPSPVTGMLRYNNQGGTPVNLEYYDGSSWFNLRSVRAWWSFDGTTASPTILNSFNVSSVTKTSTGNYVVTMSTAAPSNSYAAVGDSAGPSNGGATLRTVATSTTTVTLVNNYPLNVFADSALVTGIVTY